jgi:hypothetical protein
MVICFKFRAVEILVICPIAADAAYQNIVRRPKTKSSLSRPSRAGMAEEATYLLAK